MDPIVRRATAADADDLEYLQQLARHGLENVRGGALRLAECAPVTAWLDLIDSSSAAVLIGTLDDAVLSYMVVELSPTKDRGLVTHAYVEPGARELGLGDTMLEAAIAVVRAAGLTGIEATALPGDRETKNMYERAGLTARKLTVYKSLRAES